MDDHRAGISIDDDEIFAFNFSGCIFKSDHRRDLKRLCHDTGVGGFSATICYKAHNSFQVYLAGICRRQIGFSPDQIAHDAVRYVDDV